MGLERRLQERMSNLICCGDFIMVEKRILIDSSDIVLNCMSTSFKHPVYLLSSERQPKNSFLCGR